MGHLDGRLDPDKNGTPAPAGGVKDGPTGQKTATAPKKEDAAERRLDKASDVVHAGTAQPVAKNGP